MKMRYIGIAVVLVCANSVGFAQELPPDPGRGGPQGFGGPGGPGGFGPGGPREDRKLVEQFDNDDNGWLDRTERAEARAAAQSEPGARRGFGPPGGPRGGGNRAPAQPGRRVASDEVEHYPHAGLYEPSVLRTLFFEFENEDWEQELEDFHGTDVECHRRR